MVTGLGAVSPVGNDVASSWEALLAGRSGIGPITRFDASGLGCRIAGEVKDWDPEAYLDRKTARRTGRFALVIAAAPPLAILAFGGIEQWWLVALVAPITFFDTLNLVPLLYIGRNARMAKGGALQDVAPTLLAMMGLPQPPEMTGKSLITLGSSE